MKIYSSPMARNDAAPDSGRSIRRRRRACDTGVGTSFPLMCVISIASVWWTVDAAFRSGSVHPSLLTRSRQSSSAVASFSCSNNNIIASSRIQTARYADRDDNNGSQETATWSKEVTRSGSRLQVRKRVKAVLEKARTRTGIENTSIQKPSSVIADAATLGGLGDGSVDFIVQLSESAGRNEKNGADIKSSPSSLFPDEALVWKQDEQTAVNVNGDSTQSTRGSELKSPELDSIQADVPAAATFSEPLPFTLPELSQEQLKELQAGERVQEQSRMGREGSGYVVLDVKAPPYVVWECLLDFESYPETIPTVREMQLFTNRKLNYGYVNEKPVLPGTGRETRHYGTPSVTRASFTLSKFRLNIAAIHKYTPHPEGDYMIFTLDPSCTNMVLKGAKGTWYTKANPDGKEGWTRVYLLCEVQISRALPTFIVDYAADRAMPRATTWLRPQVEAAADLWLRRPPGQNQ